MAEEWNDVYDENRCLTGRVHLRGTPWKVGEYGLVVCVWVYDGHGHLLLTRRVSLLGALGYPVLLGTSRKSMIGLTLNLPRDQREEGTLATTVYGLMNGVSFFRVHDVQASVRAIAMTQAILDAE